MVEQYKEKNKALERDTPLLQEIVGKVWKKEDELTEQHEQIYGRREIAEPVRRIRLG